MKKFWTLTRVGLQSMLLGSSRSARRGKKRVRRSAIGAAALIFVIGLYVSGVYSFLLFDALAPMRMEMLVFILMGLGTVLSGVLMSAFAVKSTVYCGEDNELLLSMPVSSTTLMLSRVAALYLESLLFAFSLLVPAGVACAIVSRTGLGRSADFWLRLLIAVITLPMLETALSLLIGALLAWLSSKLPRKNGIGQTLVMGLYLVVVMWFAFNVNRLIDGLAGAATRIMAVLRWIRPMVWMANGILGSWGDLMRFVLVCAVPLALAVFALGRCFTRAVTAFSSQSARSDYKLTGQRARGALKALLGKELRRFAGSPTYFWNAGLGLLMLLVGAVLLLIRQGDFVKTIPMFEQIYNPEIGTLAAMAALGFCLSTVMIAAPSVSLEGRSLWVLLEAPVSTRALIAVKTGFQALVTLPFIIVAVVCVALTGLLTPGGCLMALTFGLLFEAGHAAFGMLMGLRFARLDAPNDAAVIKRSLLVFLSMFGPMAMLAVAALAGWGLSRLLTAWSVWRCFAVSAMTFAALFAVVSGALLLKNGEKLLIGLSEQA